MGRQQVIAKMPPMCHSKSSAVTADRSFKKHWETQTLEQEKAISDDIKLQNPGAAPGT